MSEDYYKDVIIELFLMAESGRLEKLDASRYHLTILEIADSIEQHDYKLRLKRFREGITNFLKSLEVTIQKAEDSAEGFAKQKQSLIKRLNSLPPHTNPEDSEKVILFARKLNKDMYNYSEVERLLENAVTRQTLKKKTDEGLLEIKPIIKKRSTYISHGDVVKLYRYYHQKKDNWGF